MTLRAVDKPTSLDEWEPFDDGEDSEAAARKAFEDGIAHADRVIVFVLRDNGNGEVVRSVTSIARRSRKLHWFACYGALTEWLQRWAHNTFDH